MKMRGLVFRATGNVCRVYNDRYLAVTRVTCQITSFLGLSHSLVRPIAARRVGRAAPHPHFDKLDVRGTGTRVKCAPHALRRNVRTSLFWLRDEKRRGDGFPFVEDERRPS